MTDYSKLTDHYRRGKSGFAEEKQRKAYLTARFPATYAAVIHVLEEMKNRLGGDQIKSFLDMGAGPGTGLKAVSEIFPELCDATCVEKDAGMVAIGSSQNFPANWVQMPMERFVFDKQYDLILFSYSFGEIKEQRALLQKVWNYTRYLILVEPGTPRNFEGMRKAREILIEAGAYILAPCPHMNQCPMSGGDWCHFSQRLNRSREHRHAKNADRSYEDEKFSYLIASKEAKSVATGRILRHPYKTPGVVKLTLCATEGLEERIISKRHGELYKKARKAKWGEEIS